MDSPSHPPPHVAQMSDTDLIDTALAKWGGGVEAFATELVGVDPATLWRWRQGVHKMSRRRRRWFERYLNPFPQPKE
jgi:hypothetical protein